MSNDDIHGLAQDMRDAIRNEGCSTAASNVITSDWNAGPRAQFLIREDGTVYLCEVQAVSTADARYGRSSVFQFDEDALDEDTSS